MSPIPLTEQPVPASAPCARVEGAGIALVTDSCCDLPPELAAELDVEVLPFPFILDGEERVDDLGRTMPHAEFYALMREGKQPSTAQIPLPTFLEAFRRHAAEGRPVVHVCFSSALSGTYQAALMARDQVLEETPGAEIHVVDSLNASVAQGVLVLQAARSRDGGRSAAELAEYVSEERQRLHGYFTLEGLEHLRRGGRISDVKAAAGAMLDIKPVLRLDCAGELRLDRSVRGRRKSLRTLADIADAHAERNGPVAIAHADAREDADRLAGMLAERLGERDDVVFMDVGPVIGAHVGPGMVAVVFRGETRE